MIVVIGGGAAGMFAAIKAAERGEVLLLEKSQQLLSKVRISGGGRCNVTHACFDPKQLIQNYPRGSKELLGPFTRFQPRDTVTWFESRGVKLKAEEDGRMFPVTDSSQTIIDCLLNEAKRTGVNIRKGASVAKIIPTSAGFDVQLRNQETLSARSVMLATGSGKDGYVLAEELGHTITPLVPSLFTFNLPGSPICELSGVSVEDALVTLPEMGRKQRGPLLITHWGLSGPAVLKLSAWAARELHACGYATTCRVDWLPDTSRDQLEQLFLDKAKEHPKKEIENDPPQSIPKRLWKFLTNGVQVTWGKVSKKQRMQWIDTLKASHYHLKGKTTYKTEFVTCGGVQLSEIHFKTMESRLVPGLFFGGEVLDIDGITGGFNFQAAWTEGWLAGIAMGEREA